MLMQPHRVQREVYVLNDSDEEVVFTHALLRGIPLLPAMPGGFIDIPQATVKIKPGQAVKLPIALWNQQGFVYRQKWAKEITEEIFLSLVDEGAPIETPPPAPEMDVPAEPKPAKKPKARKKK